MLKQGMGVYLRFTWVGNLVVKVAPSVNMAVSAHFVDLGKLGISSYGLIIHCLMLHASLLGLLNVTEASETQEKVARVTSSKTPPTSVIEAPGNKQ